MSRLLRIGGPLLMLIRSTEEKQPGAEARSLRFRRWNFPANWHHL